MANHIHVHFGGKPGGGKTAARDAETKYKYEIRASGRKDYPGTTFFHSLTEAELKAKIAELKSKGYTRVTAEKVK